MQQAFTSLPSDNFYKFAFFAGLVLMLAGPGLSIQSIVELTDQASRFNIEWAEQKAVFDWQSPPSTGARPRHRHR